MVKEQKFLITLKFLLKEEIISIRELLNIESEQNYLNSTAKLIGFHYLQIFSHLILNINSKSALAITLIPDCDETILK